MTLPGNPQDPSLQGAPEAALGGVLVGAGAALPFAANDIYRAARVAPAQRAWQARAREGRSALEDLLAAEDAMHRAPPTALSALDSALEMELRETPRARHHFAQQKATQTADAASDAYDALQAARKGMRRATQYAALGGLGAAGLGGYLVHQGVNERAAKVAGVRACLLHYRLRGDLL